MKRAALIAGCVLAGFVGMFGYRVGEDLYADWQFLRYARLQAIAQQQKAQQQAPPTTVPKETPK